MSTLRLFARQSSVHFIYFNKSTRSIYYRKTVSLSVFNVLQKIRPTFLQFLYTPLQMGGDLRRGIRN